MTCIETEEQVHKRQIFNRPIASIDCVHKSLEDYLDETDFDSPAIIWFDYTEPKGITTQIERFARTIGTDIPIVSEEESRSLKPDYFLVLPWHFQEEFLEREKKTIESGTGMIFPLPEIRIVKAP